MRDRNAAHSLQELMIYLASREIHDGELALIGTGLPMLAAVLAKRTHAPSAVIAFESGIIGADPLEVPVSVADPRIMYRAVAWTSLYKALGLLQAGHVDVGFLGGAEVDQYGNLNSTAIGDYKSPSLRLPGSGGANDIASLAKRVVIVMKHEKRRFPKKVTYNTSPGFIDGPGARERHGLAGEGPVRVISDLAVMGFHPESKQMVLQSLHPGVELQTVLNSTGFELLVPPGEVPVSPEPPADIVKLMRELDPGGVFV